LVAHILVPKHEVLSEKEVKEVLDRYGITKNELPKILKDDSALSDLKANVSDVIKITRNSPTIGKSLYYREVIEGREI
jgi:DNA-directed RNA polymerase subunit H